MHRAEEAVVRDQSADRAAGSDSVHWEVRNNLLCLEGRPLHRGIDHGLEALWNVDRDVTDSRLKIHVQIPVDIFRYEMNHDIACAGGSFDPGRRIIEPDIAGLGMALEWSADVTACNGAAGGFRVDPFRVADRDISAIRGGLDVACFDDEDRPASLGSYRSCDGACTDLSGRCMKFRIAADIADFECSALAPYFSIPTDVARFDRASLGDDGRFAFDLACGDRAACGANQDVTVGIRNIDVAGHGDEVQVDISRGDDSPDERAADLSGIRRIARKFDGFLTAAFLNLEDVVLYLDIY